MDSAKKTRVGFVGAGFIASWHSRAVRSQKSLELVAICDRDEMAARSFAQREGVAHVFTDVTAMVKEARLDVVHVLVPPEAHAAVIRAALTAGADVYAEKPLVLHRTEFDELEQAATASGRLFVASHNFLFHSAYVRAREEVRSGRLGPIRSVAVHWRKELPQLRGGPFGGWLDRSPANALLEVAAHAVAHVTDLVGAPVLSVVAVDDLLTNVEGRTVAQRICALGRAGKKAAVSLEWYLGVGYPQFVVEVVGTFGVVRVDIERGTTTITRATGLATDFDRCWGVVRESVSNSLRVLGNLASYVLAKIKVRREGNAFAQSIADAVAAFYADRVTRTDSRFRPAFSRQVVEVCEELARRCSERCEPSPPAVRPAAAAAPQVDVVLLGANGFIGREVVRQLVAAGKTVRLLVRGSPVLPAGVAATQVEWARGDLRDEKAVRDALRGARAVIHLARGKGDVWSDWEATEVAVTEIVARLCAEEKIPLVYTGTIDSYFAGRKGSTINEATPLDRKIHRRNLYARAKAASERLIEAYGRERGLHFTIVRPGIVVGSGASPLHWGVGHWKQEGVVRFWGAGSHPLPFVLVEDVAAAYVRLLPQLANWRGESLNLIGPPLLSAREYVASYETALGAKVEARSASILRLFLDDVTKNCVKFLVAHRGFRIPSYRDWKSRTQNAFFDCSKAVTRLQWKPASTRERLIEEGIARPVREWFV